ncbi:PspA/IM30 family protein [Motiliproteus sp. MSK22-1]|uniref:PspA/IM30 family protein n=1 Tax=Motiliproteus sp. MSK22-1 TaxID=1897630 RepID=UPI0009771830|nr:PspA/IM30 family protein [Motiliproteus sp. MSK22-1]OMH25760.1 hypothetical protein BGP75_24850 [Motiliproteus sp. MSK22-1]
MQLIQKLVTAMRGSTREALEVVIDANALRILDQEIIDCEKGIQQAKQELTQVVAEKLRLKREIDALTQSVEEQEQLAVSALTNNQQDVALEIAQSIAERESLLKNQQKKHEKLHQHAQQLEKSLKTALQHVERYRLELRMAQATNNAHKASQRLVSSGTGITNGLLEMESTLARIQLTQERFSDKLEATAQVESAVSPEGMFAQTNTREADNRAVNNVMDRLAQQAARQQS